MKTIEQWWREFEAMALPAQTPAVQRREMQRAFYAGFGASVMASIDMADESGDDDNLGCKMIDSLHEQCREFVEAVKRGDA